MVRLQNLQVKLMSQHGHRIKVTGTKNRACVACSWMLGLCLQQKGNSYLLFYP